MRILKGLALQAPVSADYKGLTDRGFGISAELRILKDLALKADVRDTKKAAATCPGADLPGEDFKAINV